MINDLDNTLRQLLISAGQLDPADIDISFDLPNREWAARISKPTVNCYLFDVRENLDAREQGWNTTRVASGEAGRRQPALRFALTYLITAWTREVEDEHRLLWHTLQTLTRFPVLPLEYLKGSLQAASEQGFTISSAIAKPGGVLNSPGEFWSALENHLKPSLSYVVTLPLDREIVPAGPPVFTTRLRTRLEDGPSEEIAWFGGVVRDQSGAALPQIAVFLEGHFDQSITDAEGRFRLRGPAPGQHILVAQIGDQLQRYPVDFPASTYDLTIERGEL
jgi:hypothetical protein